MNNKIIAYECLTTALLMFSGKTFAIDSARNNFKASPIEVGKDLDNALQSILRRDPLV